MAAQIWVNIDHGYDFLSDCTKLLPELMLTYQEWGFFCTPVGVISQERLQTPIRKLSLKQYII